MNDDFPRISIVIPSFQQGRFIRGAIESILLQDYPNLQLMVMDGGSTDETMAVVRSYGSHIDCAISEADGGQADAIAKGFALSDGAILAWLNCDDMYLPGALQTAARLFTENPEAGLIYGDYLLLRELTGSLESKPKVSFVYRDALYAYMPIPQPSCFIARAAYEAVGGIDRHLLYAMDFDLFLRIGARFSAHHVRQAFSVFRVHDDSKSVADRTSFKSENQLVRERALGRPWRRSDDLLVRWYLARTLWRFVVERHVLVLSRDKSKA